MRMLERIRTNNLLKLYYDEGIKMSDWEVEFLESLSNKEDSYELSAKQLDKLNQIYKKYRSRA